MGKKKKRLINICIISVLALGAIISFFIYMRGNKYSKIAWKSLSKEQQNSVIGSGFLSHTETIKPTNKCVIPDDAIMNIKGYVYDTTKEGSGYIVKNEIIICFKEWVPEYIIKEKISLMDGTNLSKICGNMYSVDIKGISVQKLNKLVDKLNNNDIVVEGASLDTVYFSFTDDEGHRDEHSFEDIKNRETEVVTFYAIKKFKLYRLIVYIVKESEKTYVVYAPF